MLTAYLLWNVNKCVQKVLENISVFAFVKFDSSRNLLSVSLAPASDRHKMCLPQRCACRLLFVQIWSQMQIRWRKNSGKVTGRHFWSSFRCFICLFSCSWFNCHSIGCGRSCSSQTTALGLQFSVPHSWQVSQKITPKMTPSNEWVSQNESLFAGKEKASWTNSGAKMLISHRKSVILRNMQVQQ